MNYPDNVDPNDPRAPWNQVEPTCTSCRDELDADAMEQTHTSDGDDVYGWPGGLCSNCADKEMEQDGCSCDESGYCSLACKSISDAEMEAAERQVRNSPSLWTGGDSRDKHNTTL